MTAPFTSKAAEIVPWDRACVRKVNGQPVELLRFFAVEHGRGTKAHVREVYAPSISEGR